MAAPACSITRQTQYAGESFCAPDALWLMERGMPEEDTLEEPGTGGQGRGERKSPIS
ncbi:hypothetical protein SBA3_1510003 [Candidatus Sulfopaludibacter sp. SbA3]|nr:hypothetical protein SBA3_1510003 [Candidatus Sulfopaludibacter sp. SbA3]